MPPSLNPAFILGPTGLVVLGVNILVLVAIYASQADRYRQLVELNDRLRALEQSQSPT